MPLVLVILLTLSGAPLVSQESSEEEVSPRVLLAGKLLSVEEQESEDGEKTLSFVMKRGSMKYTWEAPPDAPVTLHEAVKLKDLEDGTLLRIFCRKQSRSRVPETGQYVEAQYIQISAVVAPHDGYTPPKPPDDSKLYWFEGKLQLVKGRYYLDDIMMQAGADRIVARVTRGTMSDLRKKQAVEILGRATRTKKKTAALAVESITRLSLKIPQTDYVHIRPDPERACKEE